MLLPSWSLLLLSVLLGMEQPGTSDGSSSSFQEAYEAFRSTDPSDGNLLRSIYRRSTGSLLRHLDNPHDLACLLFRAGGDQQAGTSSSSSSSDYEQFCRRHEEQTSDLGSLTEEVPTDEQFDSMPNMTWSGFIWSWVPGTSSWSAASSMAASGTRINYRPIRLIKLVGLPSEHLKIDDAAKQLAALEVKLEKELAVEGISEQKHTVCSSLLEGISGLSKHISEYKDYILMNGDLIRRFDHLTHTLTLIPALTGLLDQMNSDIDASVESQRMLFEKLSIPLADLKGDEKRLQQFNKHVYEWRYVLPALEAATELLLDLLLRQMRLLDTLVKHLGEKLVELVETSSFLGNVQLAGLKAAATTFPDEQLKARILKLLQTRLTQANLEYLHSLIQPDEAKFLSTAIISRLAELAGISVDRFTRLMDGKGLQWAIMMADSNLLSSSSNSEEGDSAFSSISAFFPYITK